MNRTNITISLLSLSAAVLLVANWLVPSSASAQVSVKERDYQIVTAGIQTGGDALYILDNSTAQIGVFTYDSTTRGVVAKTVRPLQQAFQAR
jgi:hypothetical protein